MVRARIALARSCVVLGKALCLASIRLRLFTVACPTRLPAGGGSLHSKKLFALSTKQTLHVQAMKSKLNLPVSRDKGKFILTEVKKRPALWRAKSG